MAEFSIKIAGHTAAVSSLFESTRDYCRGYLTEEAPEFSVSVSREELAFEQELYDQEAREEGLRRRNFSEPFLERSVIQRKVAQQLFTWNILMFHGSAVAVDGEGYLFTAKCGTGKSTHTRLWRQVFGDRAVMVNDDKPFLQLRESEVLVCGSPWSGKHGLDTNITVPLKGICVLQRGRENRIRRAAPREVLPMLLHQGCCPSDPLRQREYASIVASLAEEVPLWCMDCTMDPQAAETAYQAMSGK